MVPIRHAVPVNAGWESFPPHGFYMLCSGTRGEVMVQVVGNMGTVTSAYGHGSRAAVL